jgi:hypothetical protein
MIPYTIYDEASGEIIITGTTLAERDVSWQAGPGQKCIFEISGALQYVSNGAVVNMPPKPTGNYIFSYSLKTWVPDIKGAEKDALKKRDQLLASGPDRVNPMWWESMSAAEQSEVSQYRQALLDITNQFGYPLDIEWPPLPSVFERSQ